MDLAPNGQHQSLGAGQAEPVQKVQILPRVSGLVSELNQMPHDRLGFDL